MSSQAAVYPEIRTSREIFALTRKQLHIVSFDVPYPPNYGGVIDVYYKAKALKALGVSVHLHCFWYGREAGAELEEVCDSLHIYERKTSWPLLFSDLPYIVASRRSDDLLANLQADQHPVLFEGLHCCAYLDHPAFAKRNKLVRTHNIEHDYYDALAGVEKRFMRRLYFRREAKKLKRFEEKLKLASHILAISPADAEALSKRYSNVRHVMAFHPYEDVSVRPGKGDFALYHGNLEVGENNQAALFLVNEVFAGTDYRLVIAGNKPSGELIHAAEGKKNISICANIPTAEIDELIASAQVNVLPTFQATGIKLKLLAALFQGRHCLVNEPMVANTGLESLCVLAGTAPEMKSRIAELFEKPFDESEIAKRRNILDDRFSNKKNAGKILELI